MSLKQRYGSCRSDEYLPRRPLCPCRIREIRRDAIVGIHEGNTEDRGCARRRIVRGEEIRDFGIDDRTVRCEEADIDFDVAHGLVGVVLYLTSDCDDRSDP